MRAKLPTALLGLIVMANGCEEPGAPPSERTDSLSLFSPTSTPVNTNYIYGWNLEIGVEMWSEIDGMVRGVRFYKGTLDTGVHVGHVWRTDGTLVATAQFVNETPSGWQEAHFLPALPVRAGEHFIVSYHTTTSFSYTDNVYQNGAFVWPLHVPANGTVYAPSSFDRPAFPVYRALNNASFFVDVDFEPLPERTLTTLYDPSTTPGTVVPNSLPVELGVKVSSIATDAKAAIRAVRFYKASGSEDTHIVHLWGPSGNLLASTLSRNETPVGWQEVPIDLNVAPGQTVVASYSTSRSYPFAAHAFDLPLIMSQIFQFPAGAGVRGAAGSFPPADRGQRQLLRRHRLADQRLRTLVRGLRGRRRLRSRLLRARALPSVERGRRSAGDPSRHHQQQRARHALQRRHVGPGARHPLLQQPDRLLSDGRPPLG